MPKKPDFFDMQHPDGQLTTALVKGGEYRDLMWLEIRDPKTRQVIVECYLHPEALTLAIAGGARQPCLLGKTKESDKETHDELSHSEPPCGGNRVYPNERCVVR